MLYNNNVTIDLLFYKIPCMAAMASGVAHELGAQTAMVGVNNGAVPLFCRKGVALTLYVLLLRQAVG